MVLPTSFFGPVSWYEQIARASEPIYIEAHENFQKQTLRTRCPLPYSNGKWRTDAYGSCVRLGFYQGYKNIRP